MRDYAIVSPMFWTGTTGKQIRSLGAEAQVIALYLITSPHSNMLGIYYLPLPLLAHETGLPLEGASKGLQRVSEAGFCAYDTPSEVVWVYEMARFQIGTGLLPKDNRVKGINKEYQRLPKNPFLKDFYDKYKDDFHLSKPRGFEAPSKPLRSQEQEQEQELDQEQDTTPPIAPPQGDGEAEEPAFVEDAVEEPAEPEGGEAPEAKPEKPGGNGGSPPYGEIIGYLNQASGKEFSEKAKATKRAINARWAEGFRLDDFHYVVDIKCSKWLNTPQEDFLRPQTLFGTKFESYLNERAGPPTTGSKRTDDNIRVAMEWAKGVDEDAQERR